MRLIVLGSRPGGQSDRGGHWNVMAADWIVMPRCRSRGRKSVVVLPWSTSGAGGEGGGGQSSQDAMDRQSKAWTDVLPI